MRNKCLLGLGLVFVISLTSMVAFAFSFTGTPADEVDETEIIVSAVVSEEADAMPTTEPITTTGQEMVKNEQSKIGSMDWDSDDAYRLAKIAMAEAESEDTEGKALVMLVVLNRVWDDEFPDTIEEVIFQKGQFTQSYVLELAELYPAVDIMQELRAMKGWCDANPRKRKTAGGMKRFINAWISKVQNRGGTPGYTQSYNQTAGGSKVEQFAQGAREWANE